MPTIIQVIELIAVTLGLMVIAFCAATVTALWLINALIIP